MYMHNTIFYIRVWSSVWDWYVPQEIVKIPSVIPHVTWGFVLLISIIGNKLILLHCNSCLDDENDITIISFNVMPTLDSRYAFEPYLM